MKSDFLKIVEAIVTTPNPEEVEVLELIAESDKHSDIPFSPEEICDLTTPNFDLDRTYGILRSLKAKGLIKRDEYSDYFITKKGRAMLKLKGD